MFITLKAQSGSVMHRQPRSSRNCAGPWRAFRVRQLSWFPRRICRWARRQGNAEYQYTLTSDDSDALYEWVPKIVAALQAQQKQLLDVNSDLQQGGLETNVVINRHGCLGLRHHAGSRSTTPYTTLTASARFRPFTSALNQYEVIMELAPQYLQTPDMLKQIYVSTSGAPPVAPRKPISRPALSASSATFEIKPRRARGIGCCDGFRDQRRNEQHCGDRQCRPHPARHRSAPMWKPWCRYRRWHPMRPERHRYRSIIRAANSPAPFRSTCRPMHR